MEWSGSIYSTRSPHGLDAGTHTGESVAHKHVTTTISKSQLHYFYNYTYVDSVLSLFIQIKWMINAERGRNSFPRDVYLLVKAREHTHTHTRWFWPVSRTTCVSQDVKLFWIMWQQEVMPMDNQVRCPNFEKILGKSVSFYTLDTVPVAHPTVSKHRQLKYKFVKEKDKNYHL